MNDAGLTLGAQTLRESKYEDVSLLEGDILSVSLVATLLQRCRDVEEALDYLKGLQPVPPPWAAPAGRPIFIKIGFFENLVKIGFWDGFGMVRA